MAKKKEQENPFGSAMKKAKTIDEEKSDETKKVEDKIEVDYSDLFKKKKKIEKILVNFTLKEDTYKRLITLAEKNNLTLTEIVETTLDRMLDSYKVKISEKAVESFKAKNERRGRPRKENK